MTQMTLEASNVALQVLEAIRATNHDLIADNMPPGWGMNKLRVALKVRHLCVDGQEAADNGIRVDFPHLCVVRGVSQDFSFS